VAHSIKKIEILLNYIRNKNKFKNRDFSFPLVQCFNTNFVAFFIQYCFKTIICFIWFNVLRFFLFFIHTKLFAFLFTLSIYIYIYIYIYMYVCIYAHSPSCHLISNTLRQKNDVIYLQLFNSTYIYNSKIVILTCMSRL